MFLSFAKVCDADRDFLIVRGTGRELDWAAVAMRMCRRRTGIGAGALLVTNRVGYTGFRLDAYGVDGCPLRADDRAVRSAAVVLHEDYGVKELLVETPAGRRWVRLAVDPLKVAVAHRSLWVWGEPELICTGELRWARRAPEGVALSEIRWG